MKQEKGFRLDSLLRRIFSRRFLKFGTVGVSGMAVNMAVLFLAQEYLFASVQHSEIKLNLSLALAIFFATLNNFIWNRMWTWADRKHHHHRSFLAQFGQYTLACWLSIVLQAIFTNLLAPHIYYLIANMAAIAVTSILNFILNDLWTFGRLHQSKPTSKSDTDSTVSPPVEFEAKADIGLNKTI